MAKSKATLQITGMTCDHCAKTVSEALKSVSGVSKAKVNLKKNEAEVTYDPSKVSEEKLRVTVVEAGYGVKDSQ
jgi:copper ion binding protein